MSNPSDIYVKLYGEIPDLSKIESFNEESAKLEALGWAAILEAILSAIISKVAGGVYDRLFESGVDYAALNRDAIQTISNIVRTSIDENTLREDAAKINALKIQIREYRTDPANNQFRLSDAIIQSNNLTESLRSQGIRAIGAFLISASLSLDILLERGKSVDSEIKNAKARAREYASYVENIIPQIYTSAVNARMSPCSTRCTTKQNTTNGDSMTTCTGYFYLDGKKWVSGSTRDTTGITAKEDAEEVCDEMFNRVRDQHIYPSLERDVINPCRSAISAWRQFAGS